MAMLVVVISVSSSVMKHYLLLPLHSLFINLMSSGGTQ